MIDHSSVPKSFPACLRVIFKPALLDLRAQCSGFRKQVSWFQVLKSHGHEWQKGDESMKLARRETLGSKRGLSQRTLTSGFVIFVLSNRVSSARSNLTALPSASWISYTGATATMLERRASQSAMVRIGPLFSKPGGF
jgi:hypothetical protein